MFGNRRLAHLGLSVLLGAASACSGSGSSTTAQGIDFDPAGFDGLEAKHFNLLSAYCTYNSTTTTLTLSPNAEELYLYYSAVDNKVVANAQKADGTQCTAAATDRISITGGTGAETVIIDYMFGQFGIATAATDPLIAINLAGGNDVVQIRATTGADAVTFGTSLAGTTFANFQTVGAKTARNYQDISMLNVETIMVSAGPGNDVITGQGGAALGLTVGDTLLTGATSLVVYGGDGDDTIQAGAASSGAAFNILAGGAGNDYFPQANVLADDQISGGAGIDTVDYSAKSSLVNVTVGKGTLATQGTATLTAATKAHILDNETFTVTDGTTTKTYEFQVSTATFATAATSTVTVSGTSTDGDLLYISYTDTASTSTLSMTFCLYDSTATSTACDADVAHVYKRVAVGNATTTAANLYDAVVADSGTSTSAALPDLFASMTAGANNFQLNNNTKGDFNLAYSATSSVLAESVTDGINGFIQADPSANLINIVTDTTAAQVASKIYSRVNATKSPVLVTLTAPTADVVAFTNNNSGAYTGILAETVTDTSFVVANTPGSAATGTDDDGVAGEADDVGTDVENIIGSAYNDLIDASLTASTGIVIMGLDGNDTLTGSQQTAAVNYIYGGKGNDTIYGGIVADFLYGGEGNDTIQGRAGSDTMDGGGVNCIAVASTKAAPYIPFVSSLCTGTNAKIASIGNDTVDYSDRTNAVTVDLTLASLLSCAAKTPSGTQGETGECDIIVTTGTTATSVSTIKNIRGGSADDSLKGDSQNNAIWGGAGNDTIYGGIGDDTLFGEAGNDIIYGCLGGTPPTLATGQSDNDILVGGVGANELYGEIGLDTIDATASTSDTGDSGSCGGQRGDLLLVSTAGSTITCTSTE
jgi:Ca2+-binding RTX toxin-like protein